MCCVVVCVLYVLCVVRSVDDDICICVVRVAGCMMPECKACSNPKGWVVKVLRANYSRIMHL